MDPATLVVDGEDFSPPSRQGRQRITKPCWPDDPPIGNQARPRDQQRLLHQLRKMLRNKEQPPN
jgi:hypothetical protein